MKTFIALNIPFTAYFLALVLSVLTYWAKKERYFSENFARYLYLLPMGVGHLWIFCLQFFFPDLFALEGGWSRSAYQYRLGFMDLGLGLTGVIAFWKDYDFCLAAGIMECWFLLGYALFQIISIISIENVPYGNGVYFLSADLLIPISIILSMAFWRYHNSQERRL